MKKTLQLLVFASLLAVNAFAQRHLVARPGDTVVVESPDKSPILVSDQASVSVGDIVKALVILRQYAPDEYGSPLGKEGTSLTTLTGTSTMTVWSTSAGILTMRKTKLEEAKTKRDVKLREVDSAVDEVTRLRQEQEDIKWALNVLALCRKLCQQ